MKLDDKIYFPNSGKSGFTVESLLLFGSVKNLIIVQENDDNSGAETLKKEIAEKLAYRKIIVYCIPSGKPEKVSFNPFENGKVIQFDKVGLTKDILLETELIIHEGANGEPWAFRFQDIPSNIEVSKRYLGRI
jgi:hypothetical protein